MGKDISNKVYVLHKTGFPSHYLALETLCKENRIQLVFREFTIISKLFKSIVKFNGADLKKQLLNIGFLVSLLFTHDKKVVLGIAPFDYKLVLLSKLLIRHRVYYHTSWHVWDGSLFPKKKFYGRRVKAVWKSFLESQAKHIFAVTQVTKSQLLKNYDLSDKDVSVVYHSFKEIPESKEIKEGDRQFPKFIYVGRLTANKGVLELLEFFKKRPYLIFTLVGKGELHEIVEKTSERNENINYLGYVENYQRLMDIYSAHDYFLLNSKRDDTWEELFGMVLIEAMSCGVVPIASSHIGPKEVITDKANGLLVEEDEFIMALGEIAATLPRKAMIEQTIQTGRSFHTDFIKNRWKVILNP